MTVTEKKRYETALSKASSIIKLQQNKIQEFQNDYPVAVVGMACKFPGGINTPEEYWNLLINCENTVTEIPKNRWKWEDYYHSDNSIPGRTNTKYGSFIHDIYKFDHDFFGISKAEAEFLNPQHSLLLNVSYKAFQNANLNIEDLAGQNGGVFIGIGAGELMSNLSKTSLADLNVFSGNSIIPHIGVGRLSYFYDLNGPSMAIDTGCSSSLVALDTAIQNLKNFNCNFALVGGVQVNLIPETFIYLSKAGRLSDKGKCNVFDNNATGYTRGEGCGFLIIKRLSDAERDNDNILAVISGSATYHSGKGNGFGSQTSQSQIKLIQRALNKSMKSPSDVSYIEAHGSSTLLGDSIEIESLSEIFKLRNDEIYVGCVKNNIANLEIASGMASLIKVILSIKNRIIPPTINIEEINSYINWDKIPVKILRKSYKWQNDHLVAGINSFGHGGTLAHVVMEEYKE